MKQDNDMRHIPDAYIYAMLESLERMHKADALQAALREALRLRAELRKADPTLTDE